MKAFSFSNDQVRGLLEGIKASLWLELDIKINQVNDSAKTYEKKLLSKFLGFTFGVLHYCNQITASVILHFAELHIEGSIRYKHTLV